MVPRGGEGGMEEELMHCEKLSGRFISVRYVEEKMYTDDDGLGPRMKPG